MLAIKRPEEGHMEPVGKDVYGRLVYYGDYVRFSTCGRSLLVSYYTDYLEGLEYELDLKRSPAYSNYWRYFHDLGAIWELQRAYQNWDCFDEECCYSCPFFYFAQLYEKDAHCTHWIDWLREECVA